jgi:CO/xanthine dehydrogenase Mo-binding subunit
MFWAGYDGLYELLRTEKPRVTKEEARKGDVEAALKMGARVVEARYEYPFQSHASMGPACAVADVREGGAVVWFGGQKPYPMRHALADLLKLPAEKVRVVWMPGPGSYGMNDADDCAADAALIAQAVGRPVRVQYMRADGTAWDPKGPPVTFRMRAGVSSDDSVFAWDYEARGFSGRVRNNGTEQAGDTLAGQLAGGSRRRSSDWPQFPAESYGFPNVRKVSHTIDWNRSMPTGLRTAHLRDPDGMATCFASESFADEVAYATKMDPVEFRLRYITDKRESGRGEGRRGKAGWEKRVDRTRAPGASSRARHRLRAAQRCRRGDRRQRRGGYADRPVSRDALHLRARLRLRGESLNLRGTIEANLIQAMSRARHEAVRFDETRVLSVDWITYPIVDMTEVPGRDRHRHPQQPARGASLGAGEPSSRPVAAAIANALFDATGVRLRRCPLIRVAAAGLKPDDLVSVSSAARVSFNGLRRQ